MNTIIVGAVFGVSAIAALLIMRKNNIDERRARNRAIDEATIPWTIIYEESQQRIAALERELARWNTIAAAIKLGDLREVKE